MAITTYSELTTAIAERYGRSDFTATVLGELIALTEARMQRQLRTVDMETKTETFGLTGEYVPAPLDFLAVRDFYVNTNGNNSQLAMVSPEYITRHYSGTDTPQVYAIVGRNFRFGPTPNGESATLVYYAKIPALSSTNTTNWLIQAHPDAYLYGALTEAAIKLQDQAAATGYGNLFGNAMDSIQGHNNKLRWTGPAMAARPA